MTVTLSKTPTAVLTEQDILKAAAKALREADKLRAAARDNENQLRALCRQYGDANRIWGFQPHHLRRACEARGLL